ncbi:MAG: diguanylate cyclase domain-containing protein [Rubrimonas sp.]|uniref:diguanylate cyclase domain-containing protein n=1 Tax=Rubrimonas sp. TaxID=2036015 RepID=UPI002FDE12E6
MRAQDSRAGFYRASRRVFPNSYRARATVFAAVAAAAPFAASGGAALAGASGAGAALWMAAGALASGLALRGLWLLLRPLGQIAEALRHVGEGARGGAGSGDEIARISRGVEALGRRLEIASRKGDPSRLDDPLTGLANRLNVMRRARDEIVRCRRKGAPLSVGLFELTHLEEVRAGAGELAADEALRRAAEALAQALRAYDVVGRWDGAIFVALMPEAEVEHAVSAMRRAREHLAVTQRAAVGAAPLGAVAGVAVLQPEDATLADIASRAGKALARARAGFGGGVEAAPGPRTRPAQLSSV